MDYAEIRPSLLAGTTLSDRIAEIVTDNVLNGNFGLGQRLNESDISERLGVSRGSLREAFRRLEQSGLIEYRPRRGCFVRRLTRQDARDIYQFRAQLEVLAVESAMMAGDAKLAQDLQIANRQMKTMAKGDPPLADLVRADFAFHSVICMAAENRLLYEAWDRLSTPIGLGIIDQFRSGIVDLAGSGARHEPIIGAIEDGDASRAKDALLRHYVDSGERLAAVLSE